MSHSGHDHLPKDCRPIGEVLSRIGDKWTILVMHVLSSGRVRFRDLHRAIGGISQRMLTVTLRNLERDGMISHTVFPTIPPRVEYELSERGRSLSVPLAALSEWAFVNQAGIVQSRRQFDKAEGRVGFEPAGGD